MGDRDGIGCWVDDEPGIVLIEFPRDGCIPLWGGAVVDENGVARLVTKHDELSRFVRLVCGH